MKSVKIILSALSFSLVVASCSDEVKIDFKKTSGGVPYKIFPTGKGKDTIAVNDVVKFHRIVKIKDSVVNNTYLTQAAYEKVRMATSNYGDPLPEILQKAHEGDSIYFVQAMDSFIVHNPQIELQTPYRKGDQIVTTIKLIKVFKNEEEARAQFDKDMEATKKEQIVKDDKIIQDHLKANNIQAQKLPSGLYVQMLNPGQGPKIADGKFAKVQYRGTLLSGQEFDAGIYPLQIGNRGAIEGFEEGVKQLAKGGRAKVFVPSPLAYGPSGSGPKIGPNTVLIFELELLDITDTMPPPSLQPADTSHAGHNH